MSATTIRLFSPYMCVCCLLSCFLYLSKRREKIKANEEHERDRPAEIVKSVDVHHVVVFDALKGYGYSGSNETSIIAH